MPQTTMRIYVGEWSPPSWAGRDDREAVEPRTASTWGEAGNLDQRARRAGCGQAPDQELKTELALVRTREAVRGCAQTKDAGLLPSMDTIGHAYDNAVIESFWGRMQTELLYRQRWTTRPSSLTPS
jgi:hypothetical protein